MKNILLIPSAALLSLLCACHQKQGLKPTALQQYIARVDAQASVKAMQQEQRKEKQAKKTASKHSKKVPVSEKLYTDPQQLNNNLYDSAGNLIYSGAPISQEQLIRINSNGTSTVVEDFLSDPQGNYIGFTPKAIYHINKSTGKTNKTQRN